MKLHLGCGTKNLAEYVNVDIRPGVAVDQIVDLNDLPWPWKDNSIEEITAHDTLEHLYPLGKAEGQMNIVAVLREIHRVLKPGGKFVGRIPTTDGPGAWQDPTHVTFWNVNTLIYFDIKSPYALAEWPKFQTFWNEEDVPFADEKPIRWMYVILVKPNE